MRTDPWMSATISRREQLNPSCYILWIRPRDTLVNLVAGQAVNVSLQPPLEIRRVSSFTVFSTRPDGSFSLLIRSTGTGGISENLVSTIKPTDAIWVSDSVPTVTLPSPSDGSTILCLVAGSGVSILGGLAKNHSLKNADIVFVGREEDSVAIPEGVIRHLAEEMPGCTARTWTIWNSSEQGRPAETDIKRLIESRDRYATVVVCGPDGFCQLVQDSCIGMGIAGDRCAIESFGATASPPNGAPSTSSSATAVIDLFGHTHTVDWPEDVNLLSAMINAGLEAPYSCRAGICSTCQCSVLIGDAKMQLDLGLSDEEKAAGLALACQLRPVSNALAVRFASTNGGS